MSGRRRPRDAAAHLGEQGVRETSGLAGRIVGCLPASAELEASLRLT